MHKLYWSVYWKKMQVGIVIDYLAENRNLEKIIDLYKIEIWNGRAMNEWNENYFNI